MARPGGSEPIVPTENIFPKKFSEKFLTHLLLENRSLVDFAIVNEGYCRDRRFCGTDPIFPTQRIPRGRDPILSTQRIQRGEDMILSTQRVS